MDSPRRTVFQTASPQDGVTEWSSKIKELQQLVDSDEATEAKKLENEIAASRLARIRRSRYGSRNNSVDATNDKDVISALTSFADQIPSNREQVRSPVQVDASNEVVRVCDPPLVPVQAVSIPRKVPSVTTLNRPEPISLAAFMGGSARGPRLRKHAPQQDAQDPAQFDQRDKVIAPHPIFGSGGVAMPGLAAKNTGSTYPTASPEISKPAQCITSRVPVAEARSIQASSPSGDNEKHLASPHKLLDFPSASTEPSNLPIRSSSSPKPKSTEPLRRFASLPKLANNTYSAPIDVSKPTPRADTSPEVRTPSPTKASPLKSSPSMPISKVSVPASDRTPSPANIYHQRTANIPPHGVFTQTTSLARTIKPEPKLSSQIPKAHSSQSRSPAFLKPQTQKDPTPSLSRLKGRGFVQSMIKVSTELESSGLSSSPPPIDKQQTSGPKRSVLDRWKPATPTNLSASPPIIAPKPISTRKSTGSAEPAFENSLSPPQFERQKRRSLPGPLSPTNSSSAEPSLHDLSTKMPPEGAPGLGSGNTLISYMKSPNTAENITTTPRARTPTASSSKDLPPPNTLLHPTRSRARKPKKGAFSTSSAEAIHTSKDELLEPELSTRPTRTPSPNNLFLSATPGHSVATTVTIAADPPYQHSSLSNEQLSHEFGVLPSSRAPSFQQRSKKPVIKGSHAAYKALPGMAAMGNEKPTLSSLVKEHPRARSPQEDVPARLPLPGMAVMNNEKSTLPSLAKEHPIEKSPLEDVPARLPVLQQNEFAAKEDRPITPSRHTRIPSTGNRATVMDVAQALNDSSTFSSLVLEASPITAKQDRVIEEIEKPMNMGYPLSAVSQSRNFPPSQIEKRKSSYEKYSSFMMPALKEETTPISSPAGTLSRAATSMDQLQRPVLTNAQALSDIIQQKIAPNSASTAEITFEFDQVILPRLDIALLLTSKTSTISQSADEEIISAEVLSISGNIVSSIPNDTDIFYDSEVLAIIRRSKSRSSGLVSSKLWGWHGRKSLLGEAEAQKLHDLSKRYATPLIFTEQYSESPELLGVLGGKLAIRQGMRNHWSAENTTMHVVRSGQDAILIDERDFSTNNLCSGFAYCISILSILYVWYGRGSQSQERAAALQYAQRLASSSDNVKELYEGDDDDEMFWMMLGTESHASANYWRWRRLSSGSSCRVWRIDARSGKNAAYPLMSLSEETYSHAGVFLLDCIWEMYVVVGSDARDERQDIHFAIDIGLQMCERLAPSRPYTPTLHVIILPSQIPLDLRIHFRELDTDFLNVNAAPDHMNILTSTEALQHLNKTTWVKSDLNDDSMLPLGLSPRLVSSALGQIS